jgi:hypothetical protein
MQRLLPRPNTGFLEPTEESWMIALPWIGGVLTIFFWILGRFNIGFEINDSALMLSGLIFVDSIHIMFTFVLLASLPELQQWARNPETRERRGWLKGLGPTARSIIITLALGAVIYFMKVSPATSTLKGMATTLLFLELLGPAQHTMAQMKGISLCYNSSLRRRFEFSDAEKAQAAKCERLERFFFTSLLWGEVMYWIPTIFELDKIELPVVDDIAYAGGAIAVASAAAIIVNAYYYPRHEESRKLAFIARVMLFPLKMLTTIGGIALRAAHGTEYLVIFRRMVKGSRITDAKRKRIFWTTIGLSLLYTIPFCLTWPQGFGQLTGMTISERLLAWAIFGTFILRFLHYYVDSILYRMSDAPTRAAVSPLLTTPPPGYEEWATPAAAVPAVNAPMVGFRVDLKKKKKRSDRLESVSKAR